MARHLFNLALNVVVLAWVAWRGISDMLIVYEWHWDIAAVVAASLYLLAVPFARSLYVNARAMRASAALRRTFE